MINNIKQSHKRIGLIFFVGFIILLIGKSAYDKGQNPMVQDDQIKAVDLLKPMENNSELILRTQGKGGVFVSAEETRVFFVENLKGWVPLNDAPAEPLTPDLTLYLNLAEDYKVIFYGTNTEMAMVQHLNHYRYFKIPKGTYEKMAFDYSIRSYLVTEPLMNAIGDGVLSDVESLNETPVNTNYKTAQIGNFTYYFYEKHGKYYVESPYFFIKELSKKAYDEAINAIPQ